MYYIVAHYICLIVVERSDDFMTGGGGNICYYYSDVVEEAYLHCGICSLCYDLRDSQRRWRSRNCYCVEAMKAIVLYYMSIIFNEKYEERERGYSEEKRKAEEKTGRE